MEDLLNTFIRAVFIDNMVFAYYLGMCSFFAISKNVKTSMGLGLTVVFILTFTVPINYLLEKYFLLEGALVWIDESLANVDLGFLSLIIFITVIASFVQLAEMFIERFLPALYTSLGIFLPLLAVNCAILGGSLFMQQRSFTDAGTATVYGLGCGVGWLLAIVGMAAISEKITYSNIPKPLRGLGIAFIITGLMGLGFMSFSGLKLS